MFLTHYPHFWYGHLNDRRPLNHKPHLQKFTHHEIITFHCFLSILIYYKRNSSIQMFPPSVQQLPGALVLFQFSSLINKGNSSIQMFRQSVELLPPALVLFHLISY